MRAIRYHEYGGPEVLRLDDDVPEPSLTPDSILVEVAAVSVNPIDWKVRSGARQKDFPKRLPAIPGRDVSGIVRALGANIRDFAVGDHVIALADATCADLVALPAADAARLPEGLDPIDAAALPLAVATGEQLVRLSAGVEAGRTVLVSGALGSVGRAAVHAAKRMGAHVIAGVRARQLAEAAELGAADTVALDDEDAIRRLGPVDAVADTVGGQIAARLLASVRPGGRFGYASVLPEGAADRHPDVTVTRVFARPDPQTLRAFAEDARDGRFVIPVSQRLPLGKAAEAQARMEAGGGGKIVLIVRDDAGAP